MKFRHLSRILPLLVLTPLFVARAQPRPTTPASLIYEIVREVEESGGGVTGNLYPSMLYVRLSDDAPIEDEQELRERLSTSGISVGRIASFGSNGSSPDYAFSSGMTFQSKRQRAESRLARILVVEYLDDVPPSLASSILSRDPMVLLAEPVPVATIFGGATPAEPDDPSIPDQGQLRYIRAEEAWRVHAGDSSVVIGIVDAGVTQAHEDLRDNIAPNYGELGPDDNGDPKESNGVDDDENGYVDDAFGVNLISNDGRSGGDTKNGEHGTQVSGYAAADTDNGIGIAGISNQCRFYPLKAAAFNKISIIGGFDGLLYAARAGYRVVNLSWGQPVKSEIEEEIVRIVVEDFDVAVVAAGGNLNEMVQFYPAGYRYVLGVGGVDQLSNLITTWGEHLDVVALAGLTTSGENDYFDLSSASSYATPIASGVVALARSKWPQLSGRGAVQHVRNQAENVDNFNFGRKGFVGRGRVDALNVVSNDPMLGPGIQIDSIWVVNAAGKRSDGLIPGESGAIRIALTNVLGDAEELEFSVASYGEDSSTITLSTSPVLVGDLASGSSWSTETGIPVTVIKPGTGMLPLRIDFNAKDYQSYDYESIPIHQTYFVLEGSDLKVSLTTSARVGGDFGPAGVVGEGLEFIGINQLYEGGIILSIDDGGPLDNLRGTSQVSQNNDFRPTDPAEFPLPVLVTVEERTDGGEPPRVEIGSRAEFIEDHPGLLRLRYYVRNVSDETFDSVRFAWFGDWDLDFASGGQRVSFVEDPALPAELFASVGVVESGLLSTLLVAVETGRRAPEDQIVPIFFANNNAGDPYNILDGFSEEEKLRTVSNGIGNRESGPGDISLSSGLVFTDLGPGEIDSVAIIFQFSTDGTAGALERLIRYKEAVYGVGDVLLADGEEISIVLDGTLLRVRGANVSSIEIVDLLGRRSLSSRPGDEGSRSVLSLENLPSGHYILLVRTESGIEEAPLYIRW